MKKEEINIKLRNLVKDKISISDDDRNFVSKLYESINNVLGKENTLQVGSYARFTAIKPLHDLDILYIIGNWDENNYSPNTLLEDLKKNLENNFVNLTQYKYKIVKQSHSITISFLNENDEEQFAIDVVPAYIFSKNEFKDDTYIVPEILLSKHKKRQEIYKNIELGVKDNIGWIHTDPRGYIQIAKDLNNNNKDFRKSVKFLKAWKNLYKDDFKFKSFHIEQIITNYFLKNSNKTIFDAIFYFFTNLNEIISKPQIIDRANKDKYIDDYLEELTNKEVNKILEAKDCFLNKLENIDNINFEFLLGNCFLERDSKDEQFLFDFKIPILIDNKLDFKIDGFVLKKDGFRNGYISQIDWKVEKDRKIKFEVKKSIGEDYTYWKVKNDVNSHDVKEVRGEITKNKTGQNPESTAYCGKHFVECYAIKNNICIAKHKIYINID